MASETNSGATDRTDHSVGRVVRVGAEAAGEILTLQRAAYVTEAQAHGDLQLPPLTQELDDLTSELSRAEVIALGIRVSGRLVAAVRISTRGRVAELGRLVVAPDQQGRGFGSTLLRAAETAIPNGIDEIHLFTGEHSLANIRLYTRFGYRETGRTSVGEYELVNLAKTIRPRG